MISRIQVFKSENIAQYPWENGQVPTGRPPTSKNRESAPVVEPPGTDEHDAQGTGPGPAPGAAEAAAEALDSDGGR